MFTDALYVFLISMIPIVELRASIPAGAALGLPWYITISVAIIGNLLPVPFILLFVKKVFD
ncbi:MAG: small multi-drug export protein, partial [Lachnospiraceae bacterium]|nr:small multi-drug export protein [Lachnospiraceae bacterium]